MAGEGKGYSSPGEEHLEKLGKFVADHESDLRELEHVLDVMSTEVWDPHSDGVGGFFARMCAQGRPLPCRRH